MMKFVPLPSISYLVSHPRCGCDLRQNEGSEGRVFKVRRWFEECLVKETLVVDVWQSNFGNKNACMMWYCHIPTCCWYYDHQISSVSSLVSSLLWAESPFCILSWSWIMIILFFPHLFVFFKVSASLWFCCCSVMFVVLITEIVLPVFVSSHIQHHFHHHPSNQGRLVVPYRGCFYHLSPYKRINKNKSYIMSG